MEERIILEVLAEQKDEANLLKARKSAQSRYLWLSLP